MYMYMYVECVFSEIVCSTLCFHDFGCMHLLLDQFFDNFLKFQKLKQPLTLSLSKVRIFAHFLKQRKTGEIWNI